MFRRAIAATTKLVRSNSAKNPTICIIIRPAARCLFAEDAFAPSQSGQFEIFGPLNLSQYSGRSIRNRLNVLKRRDMTPAQVHSPVHDYRGIMRWPRSARAGRGYHRSGVQPKISASSCRDQLCNCLITKSATAPLDAGF